MRAHTELPEQDRPAERKRTISDEDALQIVRNCV
jgi:hypothetical protein